jgi:hypothetical protein
MSKAKPLFLRRWYFETCFSGQLSRDMPLGTLKEEVAVQIEKDYSGGNWYPETLRRGEKVKARK